MKSPRQVKKHCQGANICLVGENRFQNDLFVANLKEIYGCQSTFLVTTSLSDIPSALWSDIETRVLVYLDCFSRAFEELEAMLTLCRQTLPTNCFLALYNLDESARFEKTALGYGVRGFFYPNDASGDFCRGSRGILNGQVWLSREKVSDLLLVQPPLQHQAKNNVVNLSAREQEVLAILATGVSNETIATKLFISRHTVRTHLYNIYRKINVNNRMQASLWASKNLS